MRRAAVVLATVVAAVSGSAAAPATAPAPTPLLPANSHAAYYRSLTALAGSAEYLAYTQSDLKPGGFGDPASTSLWVREADGTSYELASPADVVLGFGASMANSMLVIRAFGSTGTWYDLSNGTHGTATPAPASPDGYVAAASPDGWVTLGGEQTGNDEILDSSTAGTVTSWGVPFPGDQYAVYLIPGPQGVLASSPPLTAYMKYSTPGTWTPLSAINGGSVTCSDVSTTDAACVKYHYSGGEDGVSAPQSILQVPLDGSPVITTTPECASGHPVFSATAIVWMCGTHLDSVPLGGGPVSESSITFPDGPTVVAAQGTVDTALSPIDGPATMYAVTSAGQPLVPLIVTSHSATEASQLAVTTGRVLWQDDRYTTLPITARPVTRGDDGQLEVGPESSAFGPASQFELAASGAQTLANVGGVTLVTSPLGDHRVPITGGLTPAFVAQQPLSGNRYLYTKSVNGSEFYRFFVRDLRTGQDRAVVAPYERRVVTAAIWGNEVVYVDNHSAVWRWDLLTGKTEQLAAALRHVSHVVAFITAYHNHVGWDLLATRTIGPPVRRAYFRNLQTAAPTKKMSRHDVITQASSDGFVIERFADPSRIDLFGGGYVTATWQLRPYNGASTQTVGPYPEDSNVEVDNGVIAYLDATKQPQAIPVLQSAPQRLVTLGDPVAPRKYANKPHAFWSTYQAFSGPLANCRVNIRHAGTIFVRLPCDPTAMSTGDVVINWDGREAAGKRAHAGTYVWKVIAGNGRGPALNAAGAVPHGTIEVARRTG